MAKKITFAPTAVDIKKKTAKEYEEEQKKAAAAAILAGATKSALAAGIDAKKKKAAARSASMPIATSTKKTSTAAPVATVPTRAQATSNARYGVEEYNNAYHTMLDQMLKYAKYGPSAVKDLANSLQSDEMIDMSERGFRNWNDDTAAAALLGQGELAEYFREKGYFDTSDYLNREYITMPSTGYLKQQMPGVQKAVEESLAKDEQNKLYQSNLESTMRGWEQLEAEKNNPHTFDPMYGYAMMEYLQGDREEPFNYDQWDYEYQLLDDAKKKERLADLEKQWNSLDFDTLTGRNYKYESKTNEYQNQLDTIEKELERRSQYEAISSELRNSPYYGVPYVVPEEEKGRAIMTGVGGELMLTQIDTNTYDLQYLINHGMDTNLGSQIENGNPVVKNYLDNGLFLMEEDEKYEYNAAVALGREKEYLEIKLPELRYRKARYDAQYLGAMATDPVVGPIMSVASVPMNIWGAGMTAIGAATGEDDPYAPIYSTSRTVNTYRGKRGEVWGEMLPFEILGEEAGNLLYNIGMSTADMVAAQKFSSAMAGIFGKADAAKSIMGTVMATEVGTGTFLDDLEAGRGYEYAVLHGFTDSMISTVAESGFLDNLFSPDGNLAMRTLKSAVSEGSEEIFEEGGQMMSDAFFSYLTGQESQIKEIYNYYVDTLGKDQAAIATLKDLGNRFAIAGLSGVAMGGGTAAVYNAGQYADNRKAGKAIRNTGDPEAIMNIALGMDESSESNKIAKGVQAHVDKGKTITNYELGQLTGALARDLDAERASIVDRVQDDAIVNRLVELEVNTSDAKKLAPVIRKLYRGGKLTMAEKTAVPWNDQATQVVKELSRETKADDGQRAGNKWVSSMKATQIEATGEVLGKQLQLSGAMHTKRNVSTVVAEAVKKGEQKTHKGKDGKPAGKLNARKVYYDDGTNKGSGDILRFEESEGGNLQMVLKADTDGKGEVKVDIGNFTEADGTGTAGLIEAIKDIDENLHKVNAEEASAMLNTYNVDGGDVGQFVENYERSYLAGFSGADGSTVGVTGLDPKLAYIAYDAGKRQAEKDEADRLDRVSRARKVEAPTVGWLGDVDDNSQIRGTGDIGALDEAVTVMTDGQRYVVEYAKALAEKARINVVLFNSKAGRNGKFTADNGRYDPNIHTIYLDINAGLNDSKAIKAARRKGTLGYAMMRTLGHEVTHAIESTSAEYYAKYKQAVKNALKAKGKDWAVLVRERIDEAIADGQKMTYAEAESEIVADASEYMLQDADFSKDLDDGIVNKIKTVVKNFVTKLNDIFRELGKSGSIESYTLREMQDGVYHYMDGLQKLWGAAFEEMAGVEGANNGVEDTLYETGEVYSYTTQSSARVRDEKTIASLENQKHITTYRAMQVIDGELYPPMAEFIGSKKSGTREDASTIGHWEMATEHPELIKWVDGKPKFELKKTNDDGSVSTVPAAYNPYMHSSNTVLNDQFSKAFQRTNLVVVECVVPVSESDGAYHAQYAKDATGWHEWKSGVVAGDLAKQKSGFRRDVFLSRYIKPVRILPDSEVAEKIAGYLEGTDVTVPFQSAWPTLREALVQAGVNVTEPRGLGPAQMKIAMEAFDEWKHEYKMQSSYRRDYQYTVDGTRDFFANDDIYHHFAEKASKTIAKNPRKKLHAFSVTHYGDDVFMCVVANDGNRKFHLEDVAFIDVTGYNGPIYELEKRWERMYTKYGKEWTARFARSGAAHGGSRFYLYNGMEGAGTAGSDEKSGRTQPSVRKVGETLGERNQRGGIPEDTGEVTDSPDGIEVDNDTGSAYKPQSSARTWRRSDYVTKRDEMAQKLSQSIDVPLSTARKWLDDVSSIAAYVLDNKARVDYIPTSVKGVSAFKSNPEYGGSIDMSTICAKRRLATGTLDAIQRVLGDAVLTKDDFLHIREMMKERGYEVACGLCFVESSRKNLSKYNAQFMEQYNSTHPDGGISMTDLNTVDGLEALRSNNEDAYAEYEKFMNKLAQRKPKLFEKRTEYNHEILKKFRSDTTVDIKNLNGGMRLQSFSDFEIVHLIDMMQVITDMASVGLAGQAYTKVPDFAWALGDTGLKINLSLIAKGVDADGNLIFDDVEGMNHNDAQRLRDAYSKNVGTIVVTFTDEQLLAAMKSDMVDYIIPFHRSQWQKGDYKKLGLPEGTKDYTIHQNEKQGRKRVKENLLPNAYWDFGLSGKENAEKYLSLCAASGRTPKFAKFLVNNGDGTYSLQPDGSTDGYWKLLIDFKMYDNQGNGSPQLPVQPNFNMAEAMRMLEEYKGDHDSFPVAQDVVDDFVKEYRGDKGGVQKVDGRYTLSPIQSSARRNAPDDISSRDYLAESDDSIAETIEERNALTIYQKLLKSHADASEAVMEAEQALETAPESQKGEARKTLSETRAKQRDLYNRLLNVERTAHVQSVISRTNQFITEELQGKTREVVEKAIADREAKIAELKEDLTGLKGAAKTQREADIRQHERIVARFKSKAAQMVLENSEKYQRQIADIRLRRDINIEIGKKTRHIKRVVKALNDRIVHEEDYKNVKEPLKPAVHTLVRTFLDGFGNLVFDQKTAERLRGVYDAIAAEDAAPDFYSDDVANWLADLAGMKELDTLLRAEGNSSLFAAEEKLIMYSRVADIADHIYKMVTEADEIFINGKRASIAAVSGEVGDALVAKPDKPLLVGKAREAARIADDLLRTGNMTPQYFFDHLKNSGLTKLFDSLMDGQQQYAQAILEGQGVIAAAKGKYNFYSWQNMKDGVEFRTEQGHRIALTVPQMMWVYATAKREATNTLMDTHHLDQGGFRYESNALPREKGKMTAIPGSEKLHKLSAKDVAKITDTLTAEQKACADELVAYLSEDCAEMGNEASMKLFGIKKYNEEYYFPFKTASDQRYQNSAAGSTSTTNDARVKHASFTHSLRKGANTPLVMGDFFDVIADHINMMATYSSFVVPIESMNRVLNTKVNEDADGNGNDVTIRSLVGTKYGEPAQKYIADLLKDLNGGPQTDNRGGISALFRAFKRGAVMGSLSVTLQQPTAVARAMAYVNPKYFLHLTGEGNKKTWERMMRYSGTAVIKDMGRFDVGTGKMANDWIANSDLQSYNVWKRGKFLLHTEGWNAVKNNYVDFITALPGVMDRVTWTHIWKAIEAEQADLNPGMDRNSDDFLTIVGKRFDDVINHTQVYDSILAKSQNMRSKNPLTQMSTAFMSEPTLNINMLYDAIRGEHSGKQRAGIITSVIASNILAAAMASLISAWNKDDDERKWGEKYLTEFASRAIDSVNPLTMVPYVADIWSMINGYDIERTDLSVVKDVIEYTGKFFSNARDPEKANTWRDYENFFGTIANLLGVPAKNISRDIRRVRNLVMTDKSTASGSSLRYSLLETITPFGLYESSNTAYYERLLAATMDGDKQEQYDLKDYLMSTKGVKESSITSGVRDAYKKVYMHGGIGKNEAVSFLLANDLVSGKTEAERKQNAFEYVDKWEEGTDGHSVYNTLREAFFDGNSASIQKAWDELEANGWNNDTIGSYVRGTIIREMVTSGKITPTKATELIRKWYPYKKDKDNVSKPQEWLTTK